MRYPIGFKSIHDQDTMYFNQDVQQLDMDEFVKDIGK